MYIYKLELDQKLNFDLKTQWSIYKMNDQLFYVFIN